MKNLLLAATMVFLGNTVLGQAHQKGKMNIDAGGGVGIYKFDYKQTYQGSVSYEVEDDTAGTTYGFLNLEYGVLDFLSAGINFKRGSYIDDNANANNTFGVFDVVARGYFLNKDKFTFFGSLAFGTNGLTINRSGIIATTERYSGTHVGFGLGFKWFWIEQFGLHFAVENNRYNFDLKKYTINGDEQDINDWDVDYNVRGTEVKLGFSFKF